MSLEQRRSEDRGWLCWAAMRASKFWDFLEKRQIIMHFVSLAILYGTVDILRWAKAFAQLHLSAEVDGTEIALVIASVVAPYMALQAAAIGFIFKART